MHALSPKNLGRASRITGATIVSGFRKTSYCEVSDAAGNAWQIDWKNNEVIAQVADLGLRLPDAKPVRMPTPAPFLCDLGAMIMPTQVLTQVHADAQGVRRPQPEHAKQLARVDSRVTALIDELNAMNTFRREVAQRAYAEGTPVPDEEIAAARAEHEALAAKREASEAQSKVINAELEEL